MSVAYLDLDTGDVLRIIRRDNLDAGLGLILLESRYSNFLENYNHETDDFPFFAELEKKCGKDLRIFDGIVYSSPWELYTIDDYDFIRSKGKYQNITKEEFIEALQRFNNLWVPLENLQKATKKLLDALEIIDSPPEWIVSAELFLDLEGLMDTIILAKDRDAEEGRIKVYYG